MHIRLLYFDGCPHWKVAEERLREAAVMTDPDATEITLVRVATPDEATKLGFRGSPTLLFEDGDPFAAPGTPTSFSCRMYATEAGLEGSPSVSQLAQAIRDRLPG